MTAGSSRVIPRSWPGLAADSRDFAAAVNIGRPFRAFTSVRRNHEEVERILRTEGVLSRRRYPQLDGSLRQLMGQGELVRMLPGVYAAAANVTSARIRIAALMAYDPDAILTEAAAASVSFWSDIRFTTVSCAVRCRREPQPGYRFVRRTVPVELVVERAGLRYTSPALTALDLCDSLGGDAIDHALHTRQVTLEQLHRAMDLTAARVGNPMRRQLLLDSRDEPWSAAERLLHRLLRSAGITGWQANQPLVVGGATYHPDALFRRVRLILEVDGRRFHSEPDVFESDRWRQNQLVLDGWCVLRFTQAMLRDRPEEVLAMIRRALAMLEARI
jgi:very-short-patch-repair endonuclease